MTNEELIAKIQTEIERISSRAMNEEGRDLCEYLLSFLSTLEEQTKYKVRNPIFDECVANVDPEVREEVERNVEIENELVRFYLKDLCASEKDELTDATRYHHFPIMWDDLRDIALHFYELGCRRTAEKYDEIEYNRQMAEEEKPMQEDLEEEIDRFEDWMETYNQADYPTSFTTRDIARHFAEWGAEHLKK